MKYKIVLFHLLFAASALFSGCSNNQATQDVAGKATEISVGKESPDQDSRKVILFFGNSLTAGLGVDSRKIFTTLIQQRLDSLGFPYLVINAGVSGETTATGNSRVDWVIARQPVNIFVLELGANDGLRGIPTEETHKNLISIINKVQKLYPNVTIILAGMMIPPNMGPDYTTRFKNVFPKIAKEKNIKLIPFLLDHVAGIPDLNNPDGVHPNPEGHKIVTENIWKILAPELTKE